MAIASLSFLSADGAEALAQVSLEDTNRSAVVAVEPTDDEDVEAFVVMPVMTDAQNAISYVSNPVEQNLDPAAGFEANADILVNATSLSELVSMVEPGDLTDQMRCLAGTVYFESRGEPLAGQLAVAQVVINRSEDSRWPMNYCGVVYQRAQFSFVKNGRMPRIRTDSQAWQRAKAIARIAHEGLWKSEAADAVYFHASYVRPKWSYRKQRTARIDTHIFYR